MLNVDPKKAESLMEILRLGQATEFWKLIQESIDESKEHLQKVEDSQELRELPAEQYKLESEILKMKKRYLDHLRRLPTSIIEYLQEPPENREKAGNDDPYYNQEELKQELSKSDEG